MTRRRSRISRLLRLVPGLLCLLLVAVDIPTIHTHDGADVAFFNDECPFERLAAGSGPAGAVADPLDVGAPLLTAAAPALEAVAAPSLEPSLLSDSRAPPSLR
jgi:hypothetical protein